MNFYTRDHDGGWSRNWSLWLSCSGNLTIWNFGKKFPQKTLLASFTWWIIPVTVLWSRCNSMVAVPVAGFSIADSVSDYGHVAITGMPIILSQLWAARSSEFKQFCFVCTRAKLSQQSNKHPDPSVVREFPHLPTLRVIWQFSFSCQRTTKFDSSWSIKKWPSE